MEQKIEVRVSVAMLCTRRSWELVHLLREGQLHSTRRYLHAEFLV
jgi:hypothetical protein